MFTCISYNYLDSAVVCKKCLAEKIVEEPLQTPLQKYLTLPQLLNTERSYNGNRVDYCNSLLYGLPAYQLNKLQRVQNAAARLIFQESKYCHVRLLLCNLHWLRIQNAASRLIFQESK